MARIFTLGLLLVSQIALAQGPGRVRHPMPGYYHSIDPHHLPAGLHFHEAPMYVPSWQKGRQKTSRLKVQGPNGAMGEFTRVYEPHAQRLYFRDARLQAPDGHSPLPKWIETPVPFEHGRGSPTAVYVTLHQMKRLGVPFGGLQSAVATHITNERSVLNIPQLREQGVSMAEAVRQTHTYQYLETVLIQSGHRIVEATARVPNLGIEGEQILTHPQTAGRDRLLEYEIEFKLAPFGEQD